MDSTGDTNERAVAGVTNGLINLGEQVTWEAPHFGVRQRLTSRIVEMTRPTHFRDTMVSGAFRRFDHDHDFFERGNETLVRDRFDFQSPLGPLGSIADALVLTRYLTRLLRTRGEVIKRVAESGEWTTYLQEHVD